MADYLLELGCEEIPARFVPSFLQQMQARFEQALTKASVTFGQVDTWATYRRLAIRVSDLLEQQPDQEQCLKGPPVARAKDAEGQYLPPALGFAKKCGVSPDSLSVISEQGRDFLAFTRVEKGKPLAEVLPVLVTEVLIIQRCVEGFLEHLGW